MVWVILAHGVVLVHATFVVFVVVGGVLVARWPRMAWLHVPAVVWAVGLEWTGGICPLTPLENDFRARAGLSPYTGDFVGRYVWPVLYPAGLTRRAQIVLGSVALGLNIVVYGLLWRVRKRRRHRMSRIRPRIG